MKDLTPMCADPDVCCTMEEQIKQLRLWSVNRATPASIKREMA